MKIGAYKIGVFRSTRSVYVAKPHYWAFVIGFWRVGFATPRKMIDYVWR